MKLLNTILYANGAIGIGMLVTSAYLYHDTNQFINQSLKADGTVVDLVRGRSNSSRMSSSSTQGTSRSGTYAPVVEFKTEAGDTVEFVSSTSSNPPSYR
jgi:hypothetical protein